MKHHFVIYETEGHGPLYVILINTKSVNTEEGFVGSDKSKYSTLLLFFSFPLLPTHVLQQYLVLGTLVVETTS